MNRNTKSQCVVLALAVGWAYGCGSNGNGGGAQGGNGGSSGVSAGGSTTGGTSSGGTSTGGNGTGGSNTGGTSTGGTSTGGKGTGGTSTGGNGTGGSSTGGKGTGGTSTGGTSTGGTSTGGTSTGGKGTGGTNTGGTSTGGTNTGGSGTGGTGGTSSGAPLLHVSPNKRYLMDANNKPFYLVGDTAWALLPGLTVSQANGYFQTRAGQGFNAVMMDADVQLGASPVGAPVRGPADANGNEPFNANLSGSGNFDVSTVPAAGDTTSTAAKYWSNVDAIITAASKNGIQIILDVYDNYNPWFGGNNSPNSTAKLSTYGKFLGQRYANFDNIIWMIGNDYNENSAGDADLSAVIQGIRQYDTRHIGWAFDEYGAAFDNTGLRSFMALNSIYEYSAGPWRSLYLGQYNRSDYGPIINIEAGYENNTSLGVSTANVREEHYSFLLNGATGDTYGNEYVWPFASSWKDWQAALTSPGAHEVTYFAKLVNSVAWQNLIPDQTGAVFTGLGTPADYSGAYTSDGKLALAYRPSTGQGSQNFSVKLSAFAGQITAQWYDPTAGTYTSIGSFANTGTHTFGTPNTNSAGQNDFVLVLTAP